jgi:hypothetical protein
MKLLKSLGASRQQLAKLFGMKRDCVESEDKKAAKGTWFEIVNALMPHIEAIRAIAESEQPWVKTYIEDRPTYIRARGEK